MAVNLAAVMVVGKVVTAVANRVAIWLLSGRLMYPVVCLSDYTEVTATVVFCPDLGLGLPGIFPDLPPVGLTARTNRNSCRNPVTGTKQTI